MDLYDKLEQLEETENFADELAHGHYAMSDAIKVIRELAAEQRALVSALLHARDAAVAVNDGKAIDPIPAIINTTHLKALPQPEAMRVAAIATHETVRSVVEKAVTILALDEDREESRPESYGKFSA